MPTTRCPACGALNAEGAAQCSLCGKSLATPPNASPAQAPAHAPSRTIPAPRALGLGCLVGAAVFIVGATARAVLAPKETSMLFLALPPVITFGGLPPAATSMLLGVGFGALVSGLTLGFHNRWAGCLLIAPLFIVVRIQSLVPHDSWLWFYYFFGKGLGAIYGGVVILAAGAWGALYALAIAAAVRAYLLGVLTPGPRGR